MHVLLPRSGDAFIRPAADAEASCVMALYLVCFRQTGVHEAVFIRCDGTVNSMAYD